MYNFYQRFLFLRLGGYPIFPALIGAYHLGRGHRVYLNHKPGRAPRAPLPRTISELHAQDKEIKNPSF